MRRLVLGLGFIVALAFVISACTPIEPSSAPVTLAPGATAAPTVSAVPTVTPAPTPLIVKPAELKADPVSLLAWLFNPIFQLFLIMLVGIHGVVGDMGIAIIVTTLIVRTALVPLMRRQMVSMRRMQAIAPEIKELQRRFKGDREDAAGDDGPVQGARREPGRLPRLGPADPADPADVPGGREACKPRTCGSLKVFGFQVVPLTCPPPQLVTLPSGTSTTPLHRLDDLPAGRHPRQRLRA
jgi:hypothetical protein